MIDAGIRHYSPSDYESLPSFFQASFTALNSHFDPSAKDADLRNIQAEYLSRGGAFFVATYEGRLVGTIAIRAITAETCELKRFYVHPDFQRIGIGSRLLTTAIMHAKAGNWRQLRLDTSSKSAIALAMFLKHGFAHIARYNDDPFAEYFMQLAL